MTVFTESVSAESVFQQIWRVWKCFKNSIFQISVWNSWRRFEDADHPRSGHRAWRFWSGPTTRNSWPTSASEILLRNLWNSRRNLDNLT